jgi:epoxide hydrolase-like predicted phosphatase
MPVVEAVVFDFGGVVITPITRTIGRLADTLGCPAADLLAVLMGPAFESTDHPWHRYERGEIAQADLQPLVTPYAEAAGVRLAGNEYDRLLAPGQYEVNRAVLDTVARLRGEGVLTALLTNSVREFRPTLEQICPRGLFDAYIDSSEVGVRKPEPEIFELTLRALGVAPATAVFLDDFEGNIRGAEAAGLRTIWVRDVAEALAELGRLVAAGGP